MLSFLSLLIFIFFYLSLVCPGWNVVMVFVRLLVSKEYVRRSCISETMVVMMMMMISVSVRHSCVVFGGECCSKTR